MRTFEVGGTVSYNELHWQSDWNGYEVNYPDIPVVGLYTIPDTDINVYINTEDGTILEMWTVGDDDETIELESWVVG